jgi:hypothetical protein
MTPKLCDSLLALLTVLGIVNFNIARAAEPQFEDTFDSFDPQLGEPSKWVFVQDGALIISPDPGYVHRLFYKAMLFEDADISVRVRQTGGQNQDYSAGLVFWAEPPEFHAIQVTPDGYYQISRLHKDKWLYPVPWRTSDAIKKGLDEWNTIRVVTKGKQATVYFNDTEIITIKSQPPEGGSFIGVEGYSSDAEKHTWEFDDLRVE